MGRGFAFQALYSFLRFTHSIPKWPFKIFFFRERHFMGKAIIPIAIKNKTVKLNNDVFWCPFFIPVKKNSPKIGIVYLFNTAGVKKMKWTLPFMRCHLQPRVTKGQEWREFFCHPFSQPVAIQTDVSRHWKGIFEKHRIFEALQPNNQKLWRGLQAWLYSHIGLFFNLAPFVTGFALWIT